MWVFGALGESTFCKNVKWYKINFYQFEQNVNIDNVGPGKKAEIDRRKGKGIFAL